MALKDKRRGSKNPSKAKTKAAYAPGLYWCEITGQAFGTVGDKGTPVFGIDFKPLAVLDPVSPKDLKKGTKCEVNYERTAKVWMSGKSFEAGVPQKCLQALGYTGKLAKLDPDSPNHVSLEGKRAIFRCSHNDKGYDDWQVYTPGSGGSKNKVEQKAGVAAKLDSMFSKEMAAFWSESLEEAPVVEGVEEAEETPEVDETEELFGDNGDDETSDCEPTEETEETNVGDFDEGDDEVSEIGEDEDPF